MPDFKAAQDAFARLLQIMEDLRAGCPWDREQTFESLRILTIEETYELADAIDDQDFPELQKEIGDLFLHLVFYSKLGEEQGKFDVTTVLQAVCDKLVRRHPHIYGDVDAKDTAKVKANWEAIKLKEKEGQRKSVLDGVPNALPAMVKAYRMQEKTAGVGFDWPEAKQVWDKVQEELQELQEAQTDEERTMEFGDVFFALINYARHVGVDPEAALAKSNHKFQARFQAMEQSIEVNGQDITQMDLDAWETLWNQAKAKQG